MNSPPPTDTQLNAEAADWLVRLIDNAPEPTDPDADRAALQGAFYAWLALSRRHLETFLETAESFDKLGTLDPKKRIDIRKLLEQPPANVVRLFDARAGETAIERPPAVIGRTLRRKITAFAASAAAATLAAVGLLGWQLTRAPNYVTNVGEQRSWRLDDGSVVYLNTNSHLEVNYSKAVRQVRLVEGEALFVVEHDAARPFIVSTGTANIRAVGTQFNVYRRSHGTDVAVVEGVVQVTTAADLDPHPTPLHSMESVPQAGEESGSSNPHPPEGPMKKTEAGKAHIQILAAGEEASVSSSGQVIRYAANDVTNAVAWRQRQLVFRRATLAEVADEFNRYNKIQIRIEGDAVRGKRLSGTFSADHPQALIMYLSKDPLLSVQSDGDTWIVQPR